MADRIIDNPIINSPYRAPEQYFRFDDEGITNEKVPGRRPSQYFIPVPRPRKRGQQIELEFAEFTADKIRQNDFVNQVRDRVDIWRKQRYPHVTPTTRRLLEHWTDPERDNPILFAQREAAETAIYLAEAAQKAGDAWIRNQLNETNTACNLGLHRVALKMATGSGKTVVMAMLIAWQTLNKAAQPNDARFADAFLVVTPGLTIRDRLRVLLPEDEQNYYQLRDLVPADLRRASARRRSSSPTSISSSAARPSRARPSARYQGDPGRQRRRGRHRSGRAPARWSHRVCRDLGGTSGIVVLNDEAHHCYLDRYDNPEEDGHREGLTGDEKAEAAKNTEEARLWITGLRAINEKIGVKAVYDLSATPFFLTGSGYREGTLFPWVVSDFSLVDAIESGIVKIPRVPVDDNATTPNVAVPQPLAGHQRRPAEEGPQRRRGHRPTSCPACSKARSTPVRLLRPAFAAWEADAKEYGEPAPVFIVVCNNTTVSKMVFDYIAGWEKPLSDDQSVWVPGKLALFSNVEHGKPIAPAAHDPRRHPPARIRRGHVRRVQEVRSHRDRGVQGRLRAAGSPAATPRSMDDEDLMREVMNTVGKPGKLGEQVRCVVSVSMLTEGWDANTVTHILGVRAFGTQLLCEQVVGRGLRRRSYDARRERPVHPRVRRRLRRAVPVHARPSARTRTGPCEPTPLASTPCRRAQSSKITFPRVAGYRLEIRDRSCSRNSPTSPG